MEEQVEVLQQIIATFDIWEWQTLNFGIFRTNNVLCPVTANEIYFLFFT